LPATRDAAAFGRIGFEGQLAANRHSFLLDGLKLRFDDTTATGHGGIADLERMALAFDLDLDRINADRYLAPAAPAVAAPRAGGAAPAKGATPLPIPVGLIRSLDVHGTLAVRDAVFAGIQYSHLRVGINAAGGRLRIFPSEAQMYGGQYHGDVTLDASARLPRVSFDEHVTGVDFAPLFSDMLETRRVSGRGNAAIKAVGTGADSAALLRTLTGTLEFHVDNGALEGADLWYEIRLARALLRQQPIPARSGPERTPFTAFSATGRIANGVVSNDDLIAALQYLQVRGRGSADIAAGTLDYHLDVLVLNIPEEGSEGADAHDLVGLKLPVVISGTFAAPKVRPDLGGIVKARVQQEVDKRKDELEKKLKEQLQDKLKGLLGN
jgi:AsmA protein